MKMRQWISATFVFILTLLSGCSTNFLDPNTTPAQTYQSRKMTMVSDMLLAETKATTLVNSSRFWVFYAPPAAYYTNYIDATLPTLAMYRSDPQKWQRWTGGTFTGWSHIVGVIQKGTKFHITDIAPRNTFHKEYWVTIELDDGPYKGVTALYMDAKSLIPTMYG